MPQIDALCGDIAGIPSLFGQLSFIAQLIPRLRGEVVGGTNDRCLVDDESLGRIVLLHRSLFVRWLSCSLEDRTSDLRNYLEKDAAGSQPAFRNLLDEEQSLLCLLPGSATPAEKSLFASDMRLLRMIMQGSLDLHRADVPRSGLHDWRVRALKTRTTPYSTATRATLKTLGRDLRVSARHLGRLFRRTTGVAFHHYLKSSRLAKAADLLRSVTLSIKEISAAIGYTSSSNFSRDFTSLVGISPTRYRDHIIEVTSVTHIASPSAPGSTDPAPNAGEIKVRF